MSGWYSASGNPATGSEGLSALMRAEFVAVQNAFLSLPPLPGTGGAAVVFNPGGTALTITAGTLALAGNFATTGSFNTTLVQGASVSLTLPVVNGTLATLAGTETLSNKTLVAPALGTPVSGVATNLTGTAAGLTAGSATTATTATTATNLSGGTVAATTISASGLITANGLIAWGAPANWTGTLVNQAMTFTNVTWNGSSGSDLTAGLFGFWQIASNVNFGANGQATGLFISMLNGTSTVGGITGVESKVFINATSANSTSVEYVGARSASFASVNDGGTGGTPRGNIYGHTVQAGLINAAATNWERLVGLEVGVEAVASATVTNKSGIYILQYADTSASRGSISDRAIGVWNQFAQGAANGWKTAIDIGPSGQTGLFFPVGQDGTLIKTSAGASDGTLTVANGIDFSAVANFTGNYVNFSSTDKWTGAGALSTRSLAIANNATVGGTLGVTGVLTAPTAAAHTNTTQVATTAFVTSALAALRGYIAGLLMSRSSASVLGVSAGTCTDSTSAATINLGAFTKSTAGSWTAGTGNNGMGVGLTIANTTWYHVFAIINAGTADVYYDTSVTAANKPASTTTFRRIGSFRTGVSADILAFSQNGDEFLWGTTFPDVNTVIGSTAAVLAFLTVPPGVKVNALFRASYGDSASSSGILFTSPDETDQVAISSGAGLSLANPQASGTFAGSGEFNVRTNTSGQIRYRGAAATTCSIVIATRGFVDARGRFD